MILRRQLSRWLFYALSALLGLSLGIYAGRTRQLKLEPQASSSTRSGGNRELKPAHERDPARAEPEHDPVELYLCGDPAEHLRCRPRRELPAWCRDLKKGVSAPCE
jgi:hypothetical protein